MLPLIDIDVQYHQVVLLYCGTNVDTLIYIDVQCHQVILLHCGTVDMKARVSNKVKFKPIKHRV